MKLSKGDKELWGLHIFVGAITLIMCAFVLDSFISEGINTITAVLLFIGIFIVAMVAYAGLIAIMPGPTRIVGKWIYPFLPPSLKRRHADNAKLFRYQPSLKIFDEYTDVMLGNHVEPEELNLIKKYVRDYLLDRELTKDIISVKPKGLKTLDLYHYGWNMWNFFGGKQREKAAIWLQVTFAQLRDHDAATIYKKMHDSGSSSEIIPITEDIQGYITKIKAPR